MFSLEKLMLQQSELDWPVFPVEATFYPSIKEEKSLTFIFK